LNARRAQDRCPQAVVDLKEDISTAIWISIKLICGDEVEIDVGDNLNMILEIEKEICHHTSFCLFD
jgi:hypothetical protein